MSPPQVRYVSDWGGSGVSHRDDCREAARTERPGLTDRQRVSRIAEGIGRCDGWSLVLADGRASWVRTGYLNDTPPVPFPRGPLPRSAEPLAPAPQAPFAMESAPAPLPGPFTAVSAGGRGACGLTREGDVVCWGGPLSRHEVPPGRYKAISSAGVHACAIAVAGEVVCWGEDVGRAGLLEPPPGRYEHLSASLQHACALTDAGEAVCWGSNWEGSTEPPEGRFVAISTEYAYKGVSTSCALTAAGEVVCWGFTLESPLDGSSYAAVSSGGFPICGLTRAGAIECDYFDAPPGRYSAVSLGGGNVDIGTQICALTEMGEAVCWPSAPWIRTVLRPPEPAPGRYTAISASSTYACALTEAGEAVCWGAEWALVLPPDPAPGRYVAVSDGFGHTCALTEEREAVCWGRSTSGEAEPPPGRYAQISAGFHYTCALTESGDAVCWGDDARGRASPPPGRYTAISADIWNACALTEAGEMVCWGELPRGLGTGALPGHYTAVVAGFMPCALTGTGERVCGNSRGANLLRYGGGYVAIDGSCVLTAAGEATCRGWELAGGPFAAASGDPGGAHHCALTEAGEVLCWGDVRFAPPPGRYTAIDSGLLRTCAVTEEGEIACWGEITYRIAPSGEYGFAYW